MMPSVLEFFYRCMSLKTK